MKSPFRWLLMQLIKIIMPLIDLSVYLNLHSYFTSLILFSLYYLNINIIFIKSPFFSPSAVVTLTDCYVAKRKNKPNALILHCIHEKISFPIAMCFCNARMCIENEEETWYFTQFSTNKFYSTLWWFIQINALFYAI